MFRTEPVPMGPEPSSPGRHGRLADRVVHFARVLRAAGLPVGTDRVLTALEALQIGGIASPADVKAALAACLIDRAEHRALFEQAFRVFWLHPEWLDGLPRLSLPEMLAQGSSGSRAEERNRRLGEAIAAHTPPPRAAGDDEVVDDASWTDRERLRKADFDSMSASEWQAARRMLDTIDPFFARLPTRRYAPSRRGSRLDLRAALRAAARRGGDLAELPRRRRRTRLEPLVVIVDISGSMSRYSRMFLHFLHALAGGPRSADYRIHAFVFGTRLTPVTRQLRQRDPDQAIAEVTRVVEDWSGGTRIAGCLHEFNRLWARRVLSGSPTVLMITDGLEHASIEELGREAERLAKSCRRLVWLNPLLRYEGFQPRARGVRALMAHASACLPVHNIESLERLAGTLAAKGRSRRETGTWN